ncbi:MAG: lipopolysaccharide assembly LapA domain-containing protein [Bdellovibrionales bacterium]
MRFLTWLINLPIFLVVIVFALQNRFRVPISFWPFDLEVTIPVSLLALGLLLAGFVMGGMVGSVPLLRSRMEARSLRKQLAALQKKTDEKTPLSSAPSMLYNGRYPTISNTQEPSRPSSKKRRWFGKDFS